jgi:heme-degrading monooxygenase HmoA
MHARVTTLSMEPGRIDAATDQLREQDLPKFRELDGFRGFTLFGDRESGKAFGISFWDSEEQMQASEEAVKDSRRRAAEAGGASGEPEVERFEVLIDTFVE